MNNSNNTHKNSNARLTPAREAIYCFFESNKAPADYGQILSYLQSREFKVNKTTIYRQLDSLLAERSIRELDFGEGKKRYEINRGHHHHMVCTNCNKVECIEVMACLREDFQKQESEIFGKKNFKVKSHVLEFFGICSKCQNINKEA